MKLVCRETCRAVSRDTVDHFPEDLRRRMRNLRFLEETRSGRQRDGGFPPYVTGCPENVAVGAVAAVTGATGSQSDTGHALAERRRRSTFVELALSRYGNNKARNALLTTLKMVAIPIQKASRQAPRSNVHAAKFWK